MMRRALRLITVIVLALCLTGGAALLTYRHFFAPITITADFQTATAIYPGDQVQVSGVRVGTIESVQPRGTFTRMTLTVDRRVPIPADAQAVIVAQNLISARYVQLTPAYRSSGPMMADGAAIPLSRTAIPVEWDEVKDQLNRLAVELGPKSGVSDTASARFITSTADAMAGNGDKLRQTLSQLSGVGRILAAGGGSITDIIANLQTFVTTLQASKTQIVQFQDRLATLTSVVDGSRADLDAVLTNVAGTVGDVQRFIADVRDPTAEQIRSLAAVTQSVVNRQKDLEQILHVAPTAVANTLNMFDPRDGGATGTIALSNLSNPMQFLCGAIGAIENATAPETAKLCSQYLGPALRQLNFNYLPFPFNPVLPSVPPSKDIIYTEPNLAPGGPGPQPAPPETPPAVSAYTGAGDVPPPPGYAAPALPGTSIPGQPPASLPELLLPDQGAVAPPPADSPPPLPAEGPSR